LATAQRARQTSWNVALKLGERIMSDPRFVTTRTAAPGRAAASEQDVLLASSLLNTAQQVGGSTGLAVLGTVAWTVVDNSMHAHGARTAAATSQSAHQGEQLAAAAHQHALTTGVLPRVPGRRRNRPVEPDHHDRSDQSAPHRPHLPPAPGDHRVRRTNPQIRSM
jgi:hypothetical protein